MSIQNMEPLLPIPRIPIPVTVFRFEFQQSIFYPSSIKLCKIACTSRRLKFFSPRANSMQSPLLPESTPSEIIFSETLSLNRIQMIEGNLSVKLKKVEKEEFKWELVVSLNLKGKWLLHWGVTYRDDGSEWDPPPEGIWPPGSITIKDYAIETPFNKSSASEGDDVSEVHIIIDVNDPIDTIHFVLKEEETGAWYQHKGRDFRIPFKSYLKESNNNIKGNQSSSIWPGALLQFSSFLAKQENSWSKVEASQNKQIKNLCEEYPISKEEPVKNRMILSVQKDNNTEKKLVHIDTDIPGNVVVHWGVCKESSKNWEIPSGPHPPSTKNFRKKALQTLLQLKTDGIGSWGLFPIGSQYSGMCFVLKLSEDSWLNHSGSDFYVPLINASTQTPNGQITLETKSSKIVNPVISEADLVDHAKFTERVVNEIRNLVTDISSERGQGSKTKLAQENILQEIEKLAAEAYSIFRSSAPSFIEESISDGKLSEPATQISSGTGSGYEILCQGFNWESHKSGKWYSKLKSHANELSLMGFTTIWLPPPTESVSPEGYMPKELYNLNSRYGSMEELKDLVKSLHEVGIKVLGDVVLNHRCAHYKNNNGIWNLFGGRLNWDDRAIVADDPHFQGKGNKSSGDHFHAAPNIDHSQDFVRKDIKEWLCWLREEVGYDGWRLDYVRGFWGGYVKDYLEASSPYFAVGEYWDSLDYTYGEMDHNQDAHRQRIIDWINATNGLAGAFDVTTKGILHAAIEKCEFWRLSDQKGKPPGVVGWWPSRAVTFIENHDTGSTQGHWRFPSGKEMQGYAYILTHPGTPAVFYDHIFSCYKQEICKLISIRNQAKIHCRSLVKITKADTDVYAAEIDKKLSVKIGPGHYEPSNEKKWHVVAEGNDYIIWEASEGAHP